ncbi:glycosyltransferase [Demequina soli]|uniref:glycosyltransferase n=1 Tax=Demequina soli TaxID=1638987 RepID=UPI001471852B|nr:glycosyltransferase [Demequina soli]
MHVINDLETGGAQTLVEALSARHGRDVEVHVVCLKHRGALSARVESVATSVTYLRMGRTPFSMLRAAAAIHGLTKRLEIDVVHSHLIHSDLLAAIAVPQATAIVSTVHSSGVSTTDPFLTRLLNRLAGLTFARRFDSIVACSVSAREYMKVSRYPAARTTTILNGVPIPPRSAIAHKEPGRLTMLSLARWHPMKDHATLFEAVARIMEIDCGYRASLICAGHGMDTDNEELLCLLETTGAAGVVSLRGSVTDVRELLNEADVVVLSSAYGEALPMAGIEALAAGVPFICTDVGDSRRIVVDQSHCVPTNDPEALSRALLSIADLDEDEYAATAALAVRKARNMYSIERAALEYEGVYRRLVGER